jgi:NADH-quinone oxidoreductase subunit L
MTLPLVVLAVLSVFGGVLGLPEAFGAHPWMRGFLSPLVLMPGVGPRSGFPYDGNSC